MHNDADMIVIGGGPVGATLALALRGSGVAVTVLEARSAGAASTDQRTLALSEGSRQILQRLGVWQALTPYVTPIATIHISQRGRLGRSIMQAREQGQEALGYVLPYAALANVLDQKLAESGAAQVLFDARAVGLVSTEDNAHVRYQRDGATHECRTSLAACSVRSANTGIAQWWAR